MTARLGFVAALLLAFAGCRSEVPGVSCATTADCPAGASCEDGVCVRGAGPGDAFEALTLEAPAAGDVHNPVTVTATLTAKAGSTATPPATIELTAQPASGAAETTTLSLASGATYSGPVTLAQGGAYTLTARSAETGLESASVAVFNVDCPGACAGVCERGACVSAFSGVEITAPAAGTTVGPAVAVAVKLTRKPAATSAAAPASITVTATPSAGGVETLSATSSGADTYAASWSPAAPHGTTYTLQAKDAADNLESAPVQVTLDKKGPVLLAKLPAITRTNTSELTVLDPAMPDAFRRDEAVKVLVESSDADLDPASVEVSLTLGASAGTGMLKVPAVPATGCTSGVAGCFAAELKLYDPALALRAFDATVPLAVFAKDKAGNPATVDGASASSIKLTRFKWVFSSAQLGSVGAPALATKGRVVFGGMQSPGKLFALNPDGTRAWADAFTATNGGFTAAPVVGTVGGATYVFAGVNGAPTLGAELWALDIDKPTTAAATVCSLGTGRLGITAQMAFASPGVLGTAGASPVPVVAGLARTVAGVDVFAARLTSNGSSLTGTCMVGPSILADASPQTGVVVRQGEIYFGDDDGNVHGYVWDDTNKKFTARTPGWPVALAATPAAVSNPVLDSSGVYVTSGGSFFVVPFSNPVPSSVAASGGALLRDPMMPNTGDVLAGAVNGTVHVAKTSMISETILAPTSGAVQKAPALGADGVLYTVSGSSLTALALAGGATAWEADLASTSDSAPLLDCARDSAGAVMPGRPGVAYVGTADGKLWAVIVDSAGQSTTAPWPRFHRDPQNTGDATVTLADTVCK